MTQQLTRLEINVVTGETTVVPLTAEELADIAARAPTAEQIEAKRVAEIDTQIDALERKVMLPRLVREDLMMRFLQAAAGAGITEAQLLDPQHVAYSPGYAKMHGFNAQIEALRAQR